MLIEKNANGSWSISDLHNGGLITRTYYFMSRREALREFSLYLRGLKP